MFYTPNVSVKKITTVLHINRENRDVKNLKYNGHLRYYELILTISGENYTHFNGKTIHNVPGSVEYLPKGIKEVLNEKAGAVEQFAEITSGYGKQSV